MNQPEIEKLYTTYGFIIYGRCLKILGSPEDARDAMQVVFMQLIDRYATIRDREQIVPWIFITARNHCFNLLRARKRYSTTVDPDQTAGRENVEEHVSRRQIVSLVMKRFHKNIRDAVYYTFVEEFDQREIQRLTGQSPATIRRNLKKFRDSLPAALKRLGLDEMRGS